MPRRLALAACIALSLAGGAEAAPQGFGSSTGPQQVSPAPGAGITVDVVAVGY